MASPQNLGAARWLLDLNNQLLRCKQVLLYGNVADVYPHEDEYLPLTDILRLLFVNAGYKIIGHYDVVDGIRLADDAKMRPELERIRQQAGDASASTIVTSMLPAGSGPGTTRPTPRIAGGAHQAASVNFPNLPIPPDAALPILRTANRQSIVPVAFSLAFSDKLVGDAQHQTRDEAPLLVMLKKMLHEAPMLERGTLTNRRNVLVLIAEQLSGIPTWVYQNNPMLALIQIPPPPREERVNYLKRFVANFHNDGQLAADTVERLAEEFADLTESLTTLDLDAIRRTSDREAKPIAGAGQMSQLLDYFKFGVHEDPWSKLNASRVDNARETLSQRVRGQDHAVNAVVDMLISAQVGIDLSGTTKAGKPKGVFFFVGPTGVGKTELAKAVTGLIFGKEDAFTRFDMSEYAMEHASEKLTGSPPGFVGYEEGGQLTGRVLQKPFSLLLFDEIEKAHGKIMDKFLQILEDGRLTDSKGQTADFSQTVIIFTSNIGSDKLEEVKAEGGGLPAFDKVKEHYLEKVRSHFTRSVSEGGLGRPELLNRLGDNILVFDLLRPEHIRGIASKFFDPIAKSAWHRKELVVDFDQEAVIRLIETQMRADPENLKMGGRRVKTLMEDLVLKPLNRHVFTVKPPPKSRLSVRVDERTNTIVIT